MPRYRHLDRSERDRIAELKARGLGVTAIAEAICRNKSTVSRELKRNALADGAYRPIFAEGSYLFRRQRPAILEADTLLRNFVTDRLSEGWTPEQISGWLRRGVEIGLREVSTETIYAFIFRSAQRAQKLWRYLTRRKASRGRRARKSKDRITDKTHISQRPETANDRTEIGHWEADLVICKHSKPLLVLHERQTRLTLLTRLASKTAAETIAAITGILENLIPIGVGSDSRGLGKSGFV